jgi:DNA helicase HerA-like ATPase
MSLPINPFDSERLIGTIIQVGPSSVRLNLPYAADPSPLLKHGRRVGAGEVGEFVVMECGDLAILGRILEVKLPEKDRLRVEPEPGEEHEVHPIGVVQLLATIELDKGKVTSGISKYPRLGAMTYSAHPELIKWLVETPDKLTGLDKKVTLQIAEIPRAERTFVKMTPEKLFGRHCAILGSTGGGKSWSLARLLQEISSHNSKAILLDATGEFHTFNKRVKHAYLGYDSSPLVGSTEVVFPYSDLTEGDLFAIFSPSGQTQAPKLRAAMKSLKLLKIDPSLANTQGLVNKANQSWIKYNTAYSLNIKRIEDSTANFDISKLTKQIDLECVFPTNNSNPQHWGNPSEQERTYCVSMINRIEDMISSSELACIFQPDGKPTIKEEIEEFLQDKDVSILRISLKFLPFEHNAREIVANAIGRHLLQLGRADKFKNKPLVVFVDEAHQFLNKNIGDEHSKYPLDSFSLIAKEGRKYCLSICISTQRPRDIPEDVLSQMGTLIVHRLTTDRDREVVERASGDIDKSAAAFLPTLGPGEAVIIGVDFPIPLSIKIEPPEFEPDSQGPDFQKNWCNDEGVSGESS